MRVARAVIVGIPVAMALAATVLALFGEGRGAEGASITLYGAAVLIAIGSVIFHAGLTSNADRDHEEEARRFFDREGRWPRHGEPGGPPPG